MAIELSTITFTDQDDTVPPSGVEEILNNSIVNTLAGNDVITGTGFTGIQTSSTLNTDDGNDIITGNSTGDGHGIINTGVINTGNGKDIITATASTIQYSFALSNFSIIDTGEGNDTITGIGITGTGNVGIYNSNYIRESYPQIKTGEGNDIITGIGDFINEGDINTGNGNDSIFAYGRLSNNNSFTASNINTGNGNDTITSFGTIFNNGFINTGNGNDSLIADGGVREDFDGYGTVLLGDGKDYLKGFGSGDFNGGTGKDTLELTPGIYTVEISGTAVNFTKGSTIMKTYEFEKLIVNNTTYNFASLTNSQTISVT
jgi:hypothetical protein